MPQRLLSSFQSCSPLSTDVYLGDWSSITQMGFSSSNGSKNEQMMLRITIALLSSINRLLIWCTVPLSSKSKSWLCCLWKWKSFIGVSTMSSSGKLIFASTCWGLNSMCVHCLKVRYRVSRVLFRKIFPLLNYKKKNGLHEILTWVGKIWLSFGIHPTHFEWYTCCCSPCTILCHGR